MEKIMEFWALHGTTITNFIIGIGGAIVTFVLTRVINNSSNKLVSYLLGINTQLFGGESSIAEIRNNIQELDFIKNLDKLIVNFKVDKELRLVHLKRLLNNKKLTEEERLAYEYEFKVLFGRLGSELTSETISILDKLDEINKEV